MAVETLYATSLVSGAVSTSANALGAPNGTFTTDVDNTSWTARFAMGNPTAGMTAQGTHSITLRVRKETGTGTPTITSIRIYSGANLLAQDNTTYSVTSTTGQDVATNFSASVLSGYDLSTIDVEVVTAQSGGGPSARSCVQLDAITWSGNFLYPQNVNVLQVTEADTIPGAHTRKKARTMGIAW